MDFVYALLSVAIFAMAQGITGLVWGLRLEGKVNVQEQRSSDLKELINTKLESIDQRLARIERSLNGHLRHD